MKVLFFGTPVVAVPFLDWCIDHHEVVGAVCRADQPVGRGYALTPPPVKGAASRRSIPIFQPTGPWLPETMEALSHLKADVGVVVAYGRILPRAVFAAPRWGSFNIHFSLLPKYRGAAPMQWALIRGEAVTGVTAFWLEEGLDSGPLCGRKEQAIASTDNAASLRDKLVKTGLDVLSEVMADLSRGHVRQDPQIGNPTLAPPLKKSDGQLNWGEPATALFNRIRGVSEWPGAFTTYRGEGPAVKRLKILKAAPEGHGTGEAGKIRSASAEGIVVQTGEGTLRLMDVQPEGKKPMPAWSFWQGARLNPGDVLT